MSESIFKTYFYPIKILESFQKKLVYEIFYELRTANHELTDNSTLAVRVYYRNLFLSALDHSKQILGGRDQKRIDLSLVCKHPS